MKHLGITGKFTLLVLVPVIVLALTLILLSLWQVGDIVTNQFYESSALLLDDVSYIIEEKIGRIADQSKGIVSSAVVQKVLSTPPGQLTREEESAYLNQMESVANSIVISNPDIDSINLYDIQGRLVLGERVNTLNRLLDKATLQAIASSATYRSIRAVSFRQRPYILSVREIRSIANFEPIGYVQVNIREEVISQTYLERVIGYGGAFFVTNGGGETLSSCDQAGLLSLAEIKSAPAVPNGFRGTVDLDGKPVLIVSHHSAESGWDYTLLVPKSYITQKFRTLVSSSLLVLVAFSVVTIGACLFVVRRMVAPIREVSLSLKKVQEGDYSVQTSYRGKDEIGELSLAFNAMAAEIDRLINKVLQLELLNRQQEIKAMQAQINPHFLYNTFESISALARQLDAQPVSNMVVALAKLMRESITSPGRMVTITEEITLADYYLEIQRYRFGDRLRVYYDLNEDLLGQTIPKLTIEPIVENAIVHGFANKPDNWIIEIKVYAQGEDVVLEVSDNGEGMSPEILAGVLEQDDSSAKTGSVGLTLVNKRLQLIFGLARPVRVQSTPDQGTTVQVLLPRQEHPKGVSAKEDSDA